MQTEAPVGHKFQIHLRDIIDLLSNHLYSGPEVFARELLQNGVDAIRATHSIISPHNSRLRSRCWPDLHGGVSRAMIGHLPPAPSRSFRGKPCALSSTHCLTELPGRLLLRRSPKLSRAC